MNQNLILISVAALLISFFCSLFINKSTVVSWKILSLLGSVTNVICAAFAFVNLMNEAPGSGHFEWVISWFNFGEKPVYSVAFEIEVWTAVVWITSGIILLFYDYLQVVTKVNPKRGQAVSKALLAIGVFLTVLSGNFIMIYLGWAITSFAVFIGVAAVDRAQSGGGAQSGSAAMRFYAFDVICQSAILMGILGLGPEAGVKTFSEMAKANAAGTNDISIWVLTLLTLGCMSRSLQLPLLSLTRFISSAERLGPIVFIVGYVVTAGLFFAKVNTLLLGSPVIYYFTLIPAVTCFFAAFFAACEKKWHLQIGWLAAYVCGSTFLSALQGAYQASIMTSVSAALTLSLLLSARAVLPAKSKARVWFLSLAAISIMGMPMSALGQARLFEYTSIISIARDGTVISWVILALKVMADILISIAGWRLIVGALRFNDSSEEVGAYWAWQTAVPLILNSILCFSATLGGRPFSGLLGVFEAELMPQAAWFDLYIAPAASNITGSTRYMIGSESDVLGRVLILCVLLLPAVISLVWLFRDKKSLSDFNENWSRIASKINIERLFEYLFWDLSLRNFSRFFGRAFSRLDEYVFDSLTTRIAVYPVMQASRVFRFVDTKLIDGVFIDGFAGCIIRVSRALKSVQSGSLHFYVSFGLLITGAVIVYFAMFNGG